MAASRWLHSQDLSRKGNGVGNSTQRSSNIGMVEVESSGSDPQTAEY